MHIAQAVRAISGSPTLFWMDTFCIPVGHQHKDLGKACIDKMGLVYAGAKFVLVLDHELERLKHQDLHPTQIFGHILCSTWMERAWTLNEGCLGRTCLFQFSDGTVSVQQMIERESFASRFYTPRLGNRFLWRLGRELAELCFASQMISTKAHDLHL